MSDIEHFCRDVEVKEEEDIIIEESEAADTDSVSLPAPRV